MVFGIRTSVEDYGFRITGPSGRRPPVDAATPGGSLARRRLSVEISTMKWKAAGRRLVAAAGSVVGTRYDGNYYVLYVDPQRLLAVVADGMGDGPASTAAGRTAVDTFVRHAVTGGGPSALRSAVAEVQRAVRAAGRDSPDLTGCTLTAFVGDSADEDTAWLVQLGDSRAYRLRDGLLELLTADHTAAWLVCSTAGTRRSLRRADPLAAG